MSEDYVAGPLTEEQKAICAPILDMMDNICVMSGIYRDQEVAFLCQVERDGEGYRVTPRFIVMTPDMMNDCKDSSGRVPEGINAAR